MPHPLEARIGQVRRQARRLLWGYGLARTAAAVLAALVVLGLADYVLRFQDRGVRVICSLAALGVAGWASYRFLYRPLSLRLHDVDLARRVERTFPPLADQLSTAVAFLGQREEDRLAGSLAMRRAVVVATEGAAANLDFTAALDRRPTRRAQLAALGAGLVAGLALLADPGGARLALARLANPFGGAAWPRKNNLEFRQPPARLGSGQTFEVQVVDRFGRPLPDGVRIHYRFLDGETVSEESESMVLLRGALMARKENVTRPFQFRAAGGDDQSMPWRALEVVEPPRIDSLRIRLHPPAYTGWPAEDSDRVIRALRGTKVEVHATSTHHLAAARLELEHGSGVTAQLAADGFGFSLVPQGKSAWVIDRSGGYWFRLIDAQQFDGGAVDRWEVRAVRDEPPSVVLARPEGNIFVTPQAVVPLRVSVKDDLQVHRVALHFQRSDQSDVEHAPLPLWSGPDRSPPVERSPLATGTTDERIVEHTWSLAELGLAPGTQVTWYVAALDYLPQEGRSVARRLTVITQRELEDRVAQRQSLILAELARVLKLQQEARGQVTALEIQLREVGRFTKQDLDHAQGAELNQRQIQRTLTSRSEGLPLQVQELLADLESNRLDSPDVERQMATILDELGRLEREHLSAVERELTQAIKGGQTQLASAATAADPALNQALARAGAHQDEVARTLESLLGGLSEWDSFRRFARDAEQLRRDQEELTRQTRQVGSKTLTQDWKDLPSQQQADLKKLASRQLELARHMDKLQQQMDQSQRAAQEANPLTAATLSDAVELAHRLALGGKMRQTSAHLEQNQVGQASQKQDQSTQGLAELVDLLANRRESELPRLVKRLREAESQLAELRRQQAGLQKRLDQAAREGDSERQRRELERLGSEQRAAADQARRLARQLERLQAERAARSLATGSEKLSRSGQAGADGQADEAAEQAAAAEPDLEQAQQQLAERRRQAEADLAREQLARLEDALKSLRQRQQQLLAETDRLADLRTAQGQLTRGQAASWRDLVGAQRELEADTRGQGEKLTAAMFKLALDGAADAMRRAADRLEQPAPEIAPQAAQRSALARLERIVQALAAGNQARQQSGGGSSGGGGAGQSASEAQVRALTELKLLKLSQEDLNQRFAEASDPQSKLSPETRQAELAELAREQGQLADQALRLSTPEEPPPESDPEKLPDLRPADSADDGPPLLPEPAP